MRVILFDPESYEPLTVVEIPAWLMKDVELGVRRVRLPVPMNMREWFTKSDIMNPVSMSVVDLDMEPVRKGNSIIYWMGLPTDPELALLLRAAFLPGQQTELQRREATAFIEGVFAGRS